MDKTLIVTTGGTIESFYDHEDGTPPIVPLEDHANQTVIPTALAGMGLAGNCDYLKLAMLDSNYLLPSHFSAVLDRIAAGGYKRVVIVHGTDTMPPHGEQLQQMLAERGMAEPTIVITGAMRPLRGKGKQWRTPEHTDGWENLRLAMADAASCPPGVYIEYGQGPKDPSKIEKFKEVENGRVVRSGFRERS